MECSGRGSRVNADAALRGEGGRPCRWRAGGPRFSASCVDAPRHCNFKDFADAYSYVLELTVGITNREYSGRQNRETEKRRRYPRAYHP